MERITIKNSIKDTLLTQYQICIEKITKAIENVSDKIWSELKNDWSYGWNAYHIIEGMDFYSSKSPVDFKWGRRAGIDWEKDSKEVSTQKIQNITKKQLHDYLNDLKEKISTNLQNTSENDFLQQDGFKWFKSALERHLYSLRHAEWHLGEANKSLREYGDQRMKWK